MIYSNGSYFITAVDLTLPAPEFEFLEKGLASVREHSGGDLDVNRLMGDCIIGKVRNLFVYDLDMNVVGFVVYQVAVANYDVDRNMHLIAMFVSPQHPEATNCLIQLIRDLAPALGAKKIIGISQRKGWARRMKPDQTLTLGVWHG
jgi:hypothetical protein